MNDYAPYADLRSAARARNRTTTALKKYFSYKALHRNQRAQPHLLIPCYLHSSVSCRICGWGTLPADPAARAALPARPLTKREFYDEAQAWPRPPRRHHAFPKRESEYGCRSTRWARRSERGRAVGRELRHMDEFHEDEMMLEAEVEHAISCGYCGGMTDPGWWDGERYEWATEDLVVHAPWADEDEGGQEGEEEGEGEGEAGAAVEGGDVLEDEEWDVVSCVSEASSWEDVGEEDCV
ncbi:uncharacterized protein BDZ99DRAFT_554110 [Mytilinidion resinicola]|uniref:Uncharacterized protein n=1 Tax=Mytilinidion resinicola TaxID=574789 RepID=A0A6A6YYG7_9PEZI|nr:uncharacterized protein BDZ99DRAFT_554110 [Mytilinidion resinicola]KAF2813986.1 hypothetical protein BDZ99DRAFT_554110 [Mytilinidion resinicola]